MSVIIIFVSILWLKIRERDIHLHIWLYTIPKTAIDILN